MRVTRSRELVAEGYRPAAVARVAQISRQAIYRTPKPRRAPASPGRPPADDVEQAIVEVAMENPTNGYRLVTAWARRRLRRGRRRVTRVLRNLREVPEAALSAQARAERGASGRHFTPKVERRPFWYR